MQRSAVTDQCERIGSTAEGEQRAFAKIAWRFVPILTLGFLFNHLDRNNIGFAALQMNQEIGLTATQFGIGAGIIVGMAEGSYLTGSFNANLVTMAGFLILATALTSALKLFVREE